MKQEAGQDIKPVLPERLVNLLTSHLDVKAEPEQLTAATTFQSLGMDSLSLMELVVAAEEEFGIVLPEEAVELSPSVTLGEAAAVFERAH